MAAAKLEIAKDLQQRWRNYAQRSEFALIALNCIGAQFHHKCCFEHQAPAERLGS